MRQLDSTTIFAYQHYDRLLKSVGIKDKPVAHIAAGEWIRGCPSPIVRIYVTAEAEDSIHTSVRSLRVPEPRAPIPPQMVRNSLSSRDSAGWKMTRVEWTDAPSDAVYNFHIDFLSRTINGRTLLFVLMNVGTRRDPEMWAIFRTYEAR